MCFRGGELRGEERRMEKRKKTEGEAGGGQQKERQMLMPRMPVRE